MNFKKSALGLLAAGALSFGIVGGVLAQDSAEIKADTQSASCTIVVDKSTGGTSADPFDLGTWTWNGSTGYTAPDSNDGVDVEYTLVQSTEPGENCTYNVALDGGALTGEANEDSIPGSNLTWGSSDLSTAREVTDVSTNLKLNSVPADVSVDTYEGTLNFTIIP